MQKMEKSPLLVYLALEHASKNISADGEREESHTLCLWVLFDWTMPARSTRIPKQQMIICTVSTLPDSRWQSAESIRIVRITNDLCVFIQVMSPTKQIKTYS